ncbi:MAG: DoxX-like family protein [Luteibaculaceae bacterium]
MQRIYSWKFLAMLLFLLLAGRTYQFFFLEPPLRAFLLDTNLMEGFIELVLGITWFEYVTNPIYEIRIDKGLKITAFTLLFLTLITPFYNTKFVKPFRPLLLTVTALILLITSIGYYWDKSTQIGQFWEYSLQFGLPLMLLFFLNGSYKIALFIAKFASSATFIAHGLYAIGAYPVPGEFVFMTHRILGIGDTEALKFLMLAGILDFIFGICIWFPVTRKPALIYGIIWGFGTAAARLWANYYHTHAIISLHQFVFEVLVRVSHGAIPLWLYVKYYQPSFSFKHIFKSLYTIKLQTNEMRKTT